MSNKGVRYEHELANGIYQRTGHRLLPQRDGYSGNGGVPSADLLIEDGTELHAIEVKRTSQDAQTFTYLPHEDTPGDIDELLTFQTEYPRTVCPYLAVRFNSRQLVVIPIYGGSRPLETVAQSCPIEATVTHTDNVSIRKPPTQRQANNDENGWPSASVGDDVSAILTALSYSGPTVPDI